MGQENNINIIKQLLTNKKINVANLGAEIEKVVEEVERLENIPYVEDSKISPLITAHKNLLLKIINSNHVDNIAEISSSISQSLEDQYKEETDKQNTINVAALEAVEEISLTTIDLQEEVKTNSPEIDPVKEKTLLTYLESDTAKKLSENIDKYLKKHNINIGENFDKAKQVIQSFSPKITEKMAAIGEHLSHLHKDLEKLQGKFQDKVEHYASIVVKAFSELYNKVVDNPKLNAAIKVCTEKMKTFSSSLDENIDKIKAIGKHTSKFLSSKSTNDQEVSNTNVQR